MNKRNVESVAEVIEDFLKRKQLLKENCPWVIRESDLGGIGVFASRDIRKGEEVFRDFPLIIGPRVISGNFLFCVVCFSRNDLRWCTSFCGLPVCSPACVEQHKVECNMIKMRRKKDVEGYDEKLFNLITPLRYFFLENNDKNVVAYLKHHRKDKHGFEVDELIEKGFTFSPAEENNLRLVCSVMDANAFEVLTGNEKNCSNLKGLYPLAGLVNHSCVPNLMHVFDENQIMITKACVKIKKDEELFHSYARSIWSTPTRIYHLLRTKHFLCRCARCNDPTEFGTYMSAFLCKTCKGNVISKKPLNLKSDWICEDCHTVVRKSEIADNFMKLGSVMRSINNDDLELMLKILRGKFLNLVHANNEVLIELKYKIVWNIGYNEKYKWEEINDEILNIKREICEELLQLVDKLKLGNCKLKGLILFEFYLCLKEKRRRNALSTPHPLEIEMREKYVLHEAASILENDVSAPDEVKRVNSKI